MFIKHDIIERHAWLMLVLALGTVAIGGIVEIIPTFTIETTVEHVKGRAALFTARTRRTGHLCPRGLLSVP